MAYRIRPAEVSDSRQLAEIQVASFRSAYNSLLPAAYLAHFSVRDQTSDWEALIPEDTEAVHLVAETDAGNILGYAYSRFESFQDYHCELVALHVRDHAQDQGVGQRLFLETVKIFAAQGCHNLFLWILEGNPAMEFYSKLGGRVFDRKGWGNNDYFGVEVYELAVGWRDLQSFVSSRS